MKTLSPHLLRDTLAITPASEPVSLTFLPADREQLVREIDALPPSYTLQILRQQLAGEPAGMPVGCIHQEHARLLAEKELARC